MSHHLVIKVLVQERRWERMAEGKERSGNWIASNSHHLHLPWGCHVWAPSPWNGRSASGRGESSFGVWQPGAALSDHSLCAFQGLLQERSGGGSILPMVFQRKRVGWGATSNCCCSAVATAQERYRNVPGQVPFVEKQEF